MARIARSKDPAPVAPIRPSRRAVHPLVNRWFHSFSKDDIVCWQGQVIAQVSPTKFLVQLFEWLTGSPSTQHIVTLATMSRWTFYPDSESMRQWYNTQHQPYMDRRMAEEQEALLPH